MTRQSMHGKRRPIRMLAVTAVVVAALAVTVSAANLEGLQELVYSIKSVVFVGPTRQELVTEAGTMTVLTMPEVGLEETEDRNILTVNGEKLDITEELERNGSYLYQKTEDGTELKVEVTGSAGAWNYEVSVGVAGEESPTYSFSSIDNGGAVALEPDEAAGAAGAVGRGAAVAP